MPRGNYLALLFNGAGKRQSSRDLPLAIADLDTRIKVTSRNYVNTEKTIEDILDCVAEEIVSQEVTRKIRRLPIEGEFTAPVCAPLAAYALGVAATPTGTNSNEQQTITQAASSGTFPVTFPAYDGYPSQPTQQLPFDVTAAGLKYALESLDNIGAGNTTVSKVGNVYTITFVNKRASADIPLLTVDNALLVGGVATVAPVTDGSQRSHLLTPTPDADLPFTTFGIAFEDEEGSERILAGAVVANWRFRGATGAAGRVTFSADIIARDLLPAPGLVIPECAPINPVRTVDCGLIKNGVDLGMGLTDFDLGFDNAVLTGDSAYTGRSVKPSRLNRAIRRPKSLAYGIRAGIVNDDYERAESNPEANLLDVYALRVGTPGENLTANIPNGLTTLAGGGGLAFDNESEEAINRFIVALTKQGATPPINVVANVNKATTFLAT